MAAWLGVRSAAVLVVGLLLLVGGDDALWPTAAVVGFCCARGAGGVAPLGCAVYVGIG